MCVVRTSSSLLPSTSQNNSCSFQSRIAACKRASVPVFPGLLQSLKRFFLSYFFFFFCFLRQGVHFSQACSRITRSFRGSYWFFAFSFKLTRCVIRFSNGLIARRVLSKLSRAGFDHKASAYERDIVI